ncbi:MAG: polyprenyl diphosphate synthase [Huintestinicola sp.]
MSDINEKKLPVHIGFIMDGNGRWAQKRGMPRTYGHRQGAETLKATVSACRDIGIKYATFYAFSTENWRRPQSEVDELMRLFSLYLNDAEQFKGKRARVKFLGDKSPFPSELREKMIRLEKESAPYDDITIMLAMNYGGKADITHAARQIAELVKSGDIQPSDVDEALVSGLLYTAGAPDADLIIRPSGEQRLSNFLLWQSAYAELYFSDVLWPDFDRKELEKALNEYSNRSRRFGGV